MSHIDELLSLHNEFCEKFTEFYRPILRGSLAIYLHLSSIGLTKLMKDCKPRDIDVLLCYETFKHDKSLAIDNFKLGENMFTSDPRQNEESSKTFACGNFKFDITRVNRMSQNFVVINGIKVLPLKSLIADYSIEPDDLAKIESQKKKLKILECITPPTHDEDDFPPLG